MTDTTFIERWFSLGSYTVIFETSLLERFTGLWEVNRVWLAHSALASSKLWVGVAIGNLLLSSKLYHDVRGSKPKLADPAEMSTKHATKPCSYDIYAGRHYSRSDTLNKGQPFYTRDFAMFHKSTSVL